MGVPCTPTLPCILSFSCTSISTSFIPLLANDWVGLLLGYGDAGVGDGGSGDAGVIAVVTVDNDGGHDRRRHCYRRLRRHRRRRLWKRAGSG